MAIKRNKIFNLVKLIFPRFISVSCLLKKLRTKTKHKKCIQVMLREWNIDVLNST